ncbi:MAG: hypothetical protein Q7S58_18320 [Candidatus Binatus sp.]|uniref:hypothetical protein n=1 Tax=Candidatus Binatus sp. TaxID=2811406 RepID=UPI0027270C54|nr:hypothetical protein [Candidatus Binatus sp.]MDO8434361.1 hypothetical protein [Candidatus Binatus sp.]
MSFFSGPPSRPRNRLIAAVATLLSMLLLAIALAGCSYVKSFFSSDDADLDDSDQSATGEPLPPPVANVAVTYKRPGDSLVRATVIKFFGAEVITNKQRDAAHTETVVRFDGGVPIWEFKTTESTLGSLTGMGKTKYAVKSIEYSKLPPHFSQIIPDEGTPEPLDRGSYYVFQIERDSGSTSYQAVKVQADGSLQAYNAQPRAGSSYLLCCNVTSDFPEPVILPDTTPDATAGPPPDEPPPDQTPDSRAAPPP